MRFHTGLIRSPNLEQTIPSGAENNRLTRDSADRMDVPDMTSEYTRPLTSLEIPFMNHFVCSSSKHRTLTGISLPNDGRCMHKQSLRGQSYRTTRLNVWVSETPRCTHHKKLFPLVHQNCVLVLQHCLQSGMRSILHPTDGRS